MNNIKKEKGFTLIELMVVIVILAILSTIGLTSFRTSMMKSRDAKRKSDLEQIQRAIEMYYNDYGKYPEALNGGFKDFSWGGQMKDTKGTLYMKEIPQETGSSPEYCYKTPVAPTPITWYKLYARLENENDPSVFAEINCGGGIKYNYGVSSTNVDPSL